jgi:hypothetical protein
MLQIRQDHQMRDMGVDNFQQSFTQLAKLREQVATLGQEQIKNHKIALDHANAVSKEAWDLMMALLEQRKSELDKRQEQKADEDARPKMDYTQLGLGFLSTIQALGVAVLSRPPDKKESENQGQHKRDREASPTQAEEGSSTQAETVLMVPAEQADLVMGELQKLANPFKLQKLLSDPAEQKKFAGRIQQITGSNQHQLAKKVGGSK